MWLNIYQKHPNFKTLDKDDELDDDVIIWRYLKEKIYINEVIIDVIPNMLEKQCLYFTRADKFSDTWEGKPSQNNCSMYDFLNNKCLKRTAINCWNINDFESNLMWETYVGKGNGIVIQSSIGKLRSSFEKSVGNDEYVGKVQYLKSFDEIPTELNRFEPVLRKRCQYKDEAEVRVVTAKQNDGVFDEDGVDIPVSFEKLIEKIYLSPESDDLFKNKIEELFKKHKLDIKVLTSELSKKRSDIECKVIPEYEIIKKEWDSADLSCNTTLEKDIKSGNDIIFYTRLKEK